MSSQTPPQPDVNMASARMLEDDPQVLIAELLYVGNKRVVWSVQGNADGHWIDYDSFFAAHLEKVQSDGTECFCQQGPDDVVYEYDTRHYTRENTVTGEKKFIRRTLQDADVWEYQINTYFWPPPWLGSTQSCS